jgi:hypothetical protein
VQLGFAEAYMAELLKMYLKFPTHVEIFVLEKDYPTFDQGREDLHVPGSSHPGSRTEPNAATRELPDAAGI